MSKLYRKMKKTTHKSIILLLMYALALNPLSVVLANDLGGLLSNDATADCMMDEARHNSAMQMDNSSSSENIATKSDCKCQKDCQQGACGQQCSECGHFFAGLTAYTPELSHTHFTHNKVTSDLRHQQPMLMHYRPPKTLHS